MELSIFVLLVELAGGVVVDEVVLSIFVLLVELAGGLVVDEVSVVEPLLWQIHWAQSSLAWDGQGTCSYATTGLSIYQGQV